jgi:hypothetical protein
MAYSTSAVAAQQFSRPWTKEVADRMVSVKLGVIGTFSLKYQKQIYKNQKNYIKGKFQISP